MDATPVRNYKNIDAARSGKPRIVSRTFNGTGSWRDYESHFDVCLQINAWRIAETGLNLAVSLHGTAQDVLGNLDWRDRAGWLEQWRRDLTRRIRRKCLKQT